MKNGHLKRQLLCLCLLAVFVAPDVQANQVGQAVLTRGAVTAQLGDNVRLMGNGTPVYEGDVLTTGKRSVAVIEFEDGTKMTLREDTMLSVARYVSERGKENALLHLFKGGFRAITGFISKRGHDAFRVQTVAGTIRVRGTDFSTRVCTSDCAEEAKRHESAKIERRVRVVGRVAFLKGVLTSTDDAGDRRTLTLGGPLHEGDMLETAAATFAVLVFRDDSRITLQANSRFRIEGYRYDESAPETGQALYSLFKGGLRAASGLIGKKKPESYKVTTPVANISIRGTRFDLICQGACVSGQKTQAKLLDDRSVMLSTLARAIPAAYAQASGCIAGVNDGLYIATRQGSLVAELRGRKIALPANQTFFLCNVFTPPQLGVQLPPAVVKELGPKPEDIEVDPGLFKSEPVDEVKAGTLVVSVTDGHATVEGADGTRTELGSGETGAVVNGQAARIEPQSFVQQDPYFEINPAEVQDGLLPAGTKDPGEESLSCKIG